MFQELISERVMYMSLTFRQDLLLWGWENADARDDYYNSIFKYLP